MTAQQLVTEIRGWLIMAIDLALIIILFAMVVNQLGFRVPSIAQINPQVAVYIFGARWLMR